MSRLMAVADEIGAGAARELDPSIAGARLEWWRLEARRYAARAPQHPWLRAQLAESADRPLPDLMPLIDAAAQPAPDALRGALFVAAAELLGAPLTDEARAALADLGAQSWRDEHPAASGAADAAQLTGARRTPASALARAQARIVPLLVWSAMAASCIQRRTPLQSLFDNLRAWRIARRACLNRYIAS